MSNKQKILVTGGAGFIGSYVNKYLNRQGYGTLVLDNLSRGNLQSVIYGTLIKGDCGDQDLLNSLFIHHKISAVMHFAALTDVGESVENPAIYYENNLIQTIRLLDAMVKHQVKHLVFSSTAAIFGTPVYKQIDESTPCMPINPYGRSKWMVEKVLSDYESAYGLRFCSLRYFNAAGADPEGEIPYTKKRESNLIPIILKHFTERPIPIFGINYPTPDGTCIRDYIHIHDLATAHLLGLKALFNGAPSALYNLGNGKGFSVKEVVRVAEEVTGQPIEIEEKPRRAGDPPCLLADATKASEELEWRPNYPDLHSMIAHAWKAFSGVLK